MNAHVKSDDTREFLTFALGDQEYGVDILKVQEIRGRDPITKLPDTPDYIRGVINLRGAVVPVIDLRIKFKLERADYNELTVMIILNLGEHTVAIVVDSVSDVIALTPKEFRPTSHFNRTIDARMLSGMGVVGERILVLLDMDKVALGSDLDHAMEAASQ